MQFEHLGPYRIGRQLGRGGMGTVFEGRLIETNEAAAVKVLSAALAHEEGFRDRFEAEIESLKMLSHPHIVRLFGHGEQDGHLFYAMELVEGKSLEEELQAGRQFNWQQVIQIGIQTCQALKHAHDRGVIHRDIKPANLMLTASNDVKLSDFGIAKLFGNSGLTADGGVLGTAEYMAPEQADGRPVTHRCDLYSLGGVLYTLLAGRPPFRANNLLEMLQLQRYATPESVRRYAYDVPVELEQIVSNLLAKDPEERIANAAVLARRLKMVEMGQTLRDQQAAVNDKPATYLPISPTLTAPGTVSPPDNSDGEEYGISGNQPTLATNLPADSNRGSSPLGSTSELSAATGKAGSAAGATVTPARRFTAVDPSEQRRREAPTTDFSEWISPQTWVLLVAVVVLGLSIWYFFQPPSADGLYDRIVALAKEDKIDRLLEAESDIKSFLTHHPADPRRREVQAYLEEIDLHRLERKFELRARRLAKSDQLTPIERTYFEAINFAHLDPTVGIARLRALLDLYGEESEADAATRKCLELARRELAQLETQQKALADATEAILLTRMERAEGLRTTDLERARGIWSGVVSLYQDEPWANEIVSSARRLLAETDSLVPPVTESAAP